ncbi:histidinol-phosphate transaminase [Peptoniphilus equinus]|uniref:Histidinol-phosphate transaminase n=1 Tax=Peptoniphilus equinus TaxID=3016343 RepID=A0ABY7QVM7_9FIRM|nr:histidinol-phosphate transaminase [Peptoniphilus equinus]WBW49963.1 histidinol-phosphate transaminase [Peptoniphilus equinus]
MMKQQHGANIFELARHYGFSEDQILDFSSNINPLGPSPKALSALRDNLNLCTTYPDPEYTDLKAAIRKYSHYSGPVLLGAGTTELFHSYIQALHPKHGAILEPCYSEYARELTMAGATVHRYFLHEEEHYALNMDDFLTFVTQESIDTVIFANPNNPTGTLVSPTALEALLQTGCHVLIDETYIEFTDVNTTSAIPLLARYDNLFITRSTSKFFATPGIRLGYGLTANTELYHALDSATMLWNINIYAAFLATHMFADTAYHDAVYAHIKKERTLALKNLADITQLTCYPSFGNFILCKIENERTAKDLRDALLQNAVVIRDCADFKGLTPYHFRFCVLHAEQNAALIRHISAFFKNSISIL